MKDLPWKTNEEFYDLHANLFFKKDTFYQVSMLSHNFNDNALDILQKLQLKPTDFVVDLGCGSGFMTYKISEICQCIGVSNSKECINQAKINYPNNDFVCANMEDFLVSNATHFIALESFGYANQEKVFNNAFASLIDGGMLFIKENNLISNPDSQETDNIKYWNHYWKYYPLTVEAMISLAYKCGFILERFEDLTRNKNLNIETFSKTLKDNLLPQSYPYPDRPINILSEFVFRKQKRVKWNNPFDTSAIGS